MDHGWVTTWIVPDWAEYVRPESDPKSFGFTRGTNRDVYSVKVALHLCSDALPRSKTN